MDHFNSLLVAYDFSEQSIIALKQAQDFAQKFHAKLHVVHIIDHQAQKIYGMDISKEQQKEFLKKLSTDLAQHIDTSLIISTDIIYGNPAKIIIDKAQEFSVDLILMGSHGRKGLKHIFLGSIAEKVVRSSPLPVMICRNQNYDSKQKILFPINDMKFAEKSLKDLWKFFPKAHHTLQLIHVINTLPFAFDHSFANQFEEVSQSYKINLEGFAKKHELKLEPIVCNGNVAEEIANLCKTQKNIGLVFIAHKPKGFIENLFVGHTSEAILRYSPVSVVTSPIE